jgi:hypothetical protein
VASGRSGPTSPAQLHAGCQWAARIASDSVDSYCHDVEVRRAELLVKFRDCAARALPAERAESLLAAVQRLETLPDVSALTRLLGTGAR